MNGERFMRRALDLAAAHVGRTGENPSVGCVIEQNGVILAEAATAETGRPHAEERALEQAGAAACSATVYVTLEPCAKRTSGSMSCADLLIQAGVARVVVAALDPHPFASGVGIERLRAAGVVVATGMFEAEARAQNEAFFARWS
jgi:diaminohydroxyphosphoribosylaminopyrimidine deaminase/5-amino-6-(5-phosphoribosylamino)uracil reductase